MTSHRNGPDRIVTNGITTNEATSYLSSWELFGRHDVIVFVVTSLERRKLRKKRNSYLDCFICSVDDVYDVFFVVDDEEESITVVVEVVAVSLVTST